MIRDFSVNPWILVCEYCSIVGEYIILASIDLS
jgi:hypothetical protein